MTHPKLDRDKLLIKGLEQRKNKVTVNQHFIPVTSNISKLSERNIEIIKTVGNRIRLAREMSKPVILVFGAHTIKNGMAPTLIDLMEKGWLTHLATNGAGIIHDWELAYLGQTSEDVKENVKNGQFGIWQETGFYINLALVVGAFEGLGYGESIGKMINNNGLYIPERNELYKIAISSMKTEPEKASAAIDFASIIEKFKLNSGFINIPHEYKNSSVQAMAFEKNIPFTGHPMIGHDIIYNHPANHGAAIGRTALNDFLIFADSISKIENGVYISLGSAVMSPMIFEKAFSMAQNLALQNEKQINHHYMLIVDLAPSDWDWHKDGEPPVNNPNYYLRYCKTFSRMGGEMEYITLDNRDFLLSLNKELSY